MRKLMILVALAAVLSSCAALLGIEADPVVDNGISPVKIINKSGVNIISVYIAKSSSPDLGRDRLNPNDPILPWKSRSFDVEDGIWDVIVVTIMNDDGSYTGARFMSVRVENGGIELTLNASSS